MKIAAAYIRVSTDDQIEYSPDSQRKAILDYAKRNDYIVPQEYIFVDEGISGRSTKRPAFQQMIGTAKQKSHPFDAILVWKFSRFARNREDSVVYKSMLRKQCGVEVVSISEQIGEDKTSILIEALLEAMDEYYSINLSEEVVRGMSEKARRGGTLGRAVDLQRLFKRHRNADYRHPAEQQRHTHRIRKALGEPYSGICAAEYHLCRTPALDSRRDKRHETRRKNQREYHCQKQRPYRDCIRRAIRRGTREDRGEQT